jgi:carboxyl-terminal processing protease
VNREELVDKGLDAAVDSLDDRFSHYFDPNAYRAFEEATAGAFEGVGMNVEAVPRGLRVVSVFDRSPAQRGGVKAGDVITAVDGKAIAGTSTDEATTLIKGRSGTRVVLTVASPGRKARSVPLRRARVDVPVVRSEMRTSGGTKVAHVTLSSFTSGAHGEVRTAVERLLARGARGVVLDLRHNGGGLLNEAVLVSSIFIPDGTIVSTKGRARPRRVFKATGSSIDPKIPVVVLVDRASASASEIVTGALQDRDRARVVGTRTFGKGVFQEIRRLSNGGALDITVGEYFTPDGRNLGGGGVRQGAGIRPDVRAVDDIKTRNRDEALDVAVATVLAKAT